MSTVNLGNFVVTQESYNRARASTENARANHTGRKTAQDVLSTLRDSKPGWVISTSRSDWGPGARNIQIDSRTLQRMADDPEVMTRYKALMMDFELQVPAVEQWMEENPGQSIELGINLDEQGRMQAMALIRSLMGGETVHTTTLPGNSVDTWSTILGNMLESIKSGEAHGVERNWKA